MFKSKSKGFTLLELVLVLGVGASITFMKFQDMVNDQEYTQARLAGEQIKQLGEAVNKYISIRYDKISTLTNAAGTGIDPGPRTCSSTTNVCAITYQTLVNEGLLPTTYSGMNNFRSGYNITLKRAGASPNYVVNGLVSTSGAWINNGKIRYDLLGRAIQSAGIDSGMSKSTTQADGYNGMWTASFADYGVSAPAGILTYRVGYDSALYSIYLRRDGTLPMTGDLDMGNHDIDNAKNITASGGGQFGGNVTTNGIDPSDLPPGWAGGIRTNDIVATATIAVVPLGKTAASVASASDMAVYMDRFGNIGASNSISSAKTITAGTTITAGGDVIAHNGYGDAISFGGDSAGNDFDVKLSGKNYLGFLSVERTPITIGVNGKLFVRPSSADSTNGNSVTLDSSNGSIVSTGRIGSMGTNPNNLPFGWAGGFRTWDILAGGTIGVLPANVVDASKITNTNQLAATIDQGGNIYASSNIISGNAITANGRITTNEFLQINGQANPNTACSPNGLQGRTPAGALVSCVNGLWAQGGYTVSVYRVGYTNASSGSSSNNYQTNNMGNHLFCALAGNQEADGMTKHVMVSKTASGWVLEQRITLWPSGIDTWAYANCYD